MIKIFMVGILQKLKEILTFNFMTNILSLKNGNPFTSQFTEFLRKKQMYITIGYKP